MHPANQTAPNPETLRQRWSVTLVEQVFQRLKTGAELTPVIALLPAENRLPGVDLRGIDLSGCELKTDAGAGMQLPGAHLEWANFKGAALQAANFAGAFLEGADFTEVTGKNINFEGAQLKHAIFQHAQLTFTNFQRIQAPAANFQQSDLMGSTFKSAQLAATNWRETQLKQVNFARAWLVGADFRNAALEGTNFAYATLEECDLRGVDVNQGNWQRVKARTAILNPQVTSIHQRVLLQPILDKCAAGLDWFIQNVGHVFKVILLLTFLWLIAWIYHRIKPPDVGTVEIIPFEVSINGTAEKEYGIFLTNKLIESRSAIFKVLEQIQTDGSGTRATSLPDPKLSFLNQKLIEHDEAGITEPVLEYYSGQMMNQNLVLSTLSHYQRFEKYSFPMTEFQVLQFIIDLRRVKTQNPVLSGTFTKDTEHVKSIVRLERGDRTLGIWAIDTTGIDDITMVQQIATQMVKDELSQTNPFFKDVSVNGFEHYLDGLRALANYFQRKKYPDPLISQRLRLLKTAETAFDGVRQTDFNFAPAYFYLAIVQYESGKYDPAAFQKCIVNNNTAWKLLVRQLTMLQQSMNQFLAQNDLESVANYQYLYRETRENLQNTFTNLANAYNMNAQRFAPMSEDFFENLGFASEYYLKTLQFDSLNANLYINLAEVYQKMRRTALARSYYTQAIQRGVMNARVFYRLGALYSQIDSLNDALPLLQKATELDPQNVIYHLKLGQLYLRQNQPDKSQAEFELVYKIARQVFGNDPKAYSFLGNEFMENELYVYAVRGFKLADSLFMEKRSTNSDIKFNLGLSLQELKEYQQAIPYFEVSQRTERYQGIASYNLACAYAQVGRLQNACRWLRTALALEATSREQVEADADLKPLRDSECYRKLWQTDTESERSK